VFTKFGALKAGGALYQVEGFHRKQGGSMRKLTIDRKTFENAPRVTMGRREILLGLAAGTVVPLTAGCETTSGGFGEFLVSDAQIQQASQASWSQALQRERVSRDPALRRRVERVGNRMVPVSGLTQYDWEFVVFESDTENAWVLPNGKVAFYRGLLDNMRNDDEIAVVMGHEIGHVRRNHAAQRARQQAAAGLGLAIVSVGLGAAEVENADQWAGILGAGLTFGVLLPYSRQHEYEADQLGVDYMDGSGYRPSQAISFWEGMSRRSAGRSRPPAFLSTHPNDQQRMAALRQHIQARGYA
jgi:predicted Zn-dependent protease